MSSKLHTSQRNVHNNEYTVFEHVLSYKQGRDPLSSLVTLHVLLWLCRWFTWLIFGAVDAKLLPLIKPLYTQKQIDTNRTLNKAVNDPDFHSAWSVLLD